MLTTTSSSSSSRMSSQGVDGESSTAVAAGRGQRQCTASCCSLLGLAQRLLPHIFCTRALYAITFLAFAFDLFTFTALVNIIATTWSAGCELYLWFLVFATAQATRFGAFVLIGHRMRVLWILPQFIIRVQSNIFSTTYLFFRIFSLYIAFVSAPLLLYARHHIPTQVDACPSSLTHACLWLTAYDLALAILTLGILLLVRIAVRSQQQARWTATDRTALASLSWHQLSHPAAWMRPGELAPFTPLSLWLTHIFWPAVLVQAPQTIAPVVAKPAPPGLTDQEIAMLPVCAYNENMLDASRRTCVVCHDEFSHKDELRVLPCIHHFHRTCVDPWLSRRASCPLCVTPIAFDGVGAGGGGESASTTPQHASITIRDSTGANHAVGGGTAERHNKAVNDDFESEPHATGPTLSSSLSLRSVHFEQHQERAQHQHHERAQQNAPAPHVPSQPIRSALRPTAGEASDHSSHNVVQSTRRPREPAHVRFSIVNQLIPLPSREDEQCHSRAEGERDDDDREVDVVNADGDSNALVRLTEESGGDGNDAGVPSETFSVEHLQ